MRAVAAAPVAAEAAAMMARVDLDMIIDVMEGGGQGEKGEKGEKEERGIVLA
jgi:hypothetical protein